MMYPPCNFCYHVLHIIPATTSGAYPSLEKMEHQTRIFIRTVKQKWLIIPVNLLRFSLHMNALSPCNHYAIPLEISDTIRAALKAKLWRMGKLFSKLGGTKCQEQLIKWKDGSEATWNFVVNEVEVQRQLLKRKRLIEVQIEKESTKRRKLENEVKVLQKTTTTKKQAKVIARLKTGRLENSRGSSSKSWLEYSRQQQYSKKNLAKNVQSALSFMWGRRI